MNTQKIPACPLSFTPTALVYIQGWLKKQNKEGGYFRLSAKQAGCSGWKYVTEIVEAPEPSDYVMQVDALLPNATPLQVCIAQEHLPLFQGLCVDYGKPADADPKNPLQAAQLLFINPNEKGRCGCGESFNA